jgi:hypothetical protein
LKVENKGKLRTKADSYSTIRNNLKVLINAVVEDFQGTSELAGNRGFPTLTFPSPFTPFFFFISWRKLKTGPKPSVGVGPCKDSTRLKGN